MGRRADAVLLVGPLVVAIEFKVGEKQFDRAAVDQAWDYALDLKNFHEGSHDAWLVPILVATAAAASPPLNFLWDQDRVFRPVLVNGAELRNAINVAPCEVSGSHLDAERWAAASYRPTPTIVEAARALYAQHSVEAIARHDAGAQNLRVTSRQLEEIVALARADR